MTITQAEIVALWPYLLGYLAFVIFPNQPINWVTSDMWSDLVQRADDPESSNINFSGKIGFIERTLYVGSILAGKPEFIGIWLVLKVAGRFWKDEKVLKDDGTEVPSRAIFQVFLIGSGLSIIYAVIGAKCIQWCLSENFLFAVFFGASLIPTTLILRYYPKLQNG
jgi:hypothetical protein